MVPPRRPQADASQPTSTPCKTEAAATLDSPMAEKPSERLNDLNAFEPSSPSPTLHLELISKRFVLFVLIAVAFSVVFNVVFLVGVTVDSGILEKIGSSTKADFSVEYFNTICGYVMALVGLALDLLYGCFFSAFVVYLHNLSWYPGDDTSTSKVATLKRIGLFLFAFGVPFALRNSFSSLKATQSTIGFSHVMTQDDVAFQDPLHYIFKSNKSTSTSTLALTGKSIESTILRNALREETVPFAFDIKSKCVRKIKTGKKNRVYSKLHLNVQDLAGTAAVYGFQPKEWNREMLPNELKPNFSETIRFGDFEKHPHAFSTQFDLKTALELVLQGKTIFERSVTDSNRQIYNCTDSDARADLDLALNDPWLVQQRDQRDQRAQAEVEGQTTNTNASPSNGARRHRRLISEDVNDDGEWDFESSGNADSTLDDQVAWNYDITTGKRLCNGVISSLYDLRDYQNKANHNLEYVLDAIALGLEESVPALDLNDTTVTFEAYQINDQIELKAMRVNLQMNANLTYGVMPPGCLNNATEHFLSNEQKQMLCNPALYLYHDNHDDFCGSKSCVFLDGSKTFLLRKEVSMIPYMKNCDVGKLQYDEDYENFFPTKCQPQNDSVFLYGLGSYISGAEFGSDYDNLGIPYISKPRRNIRMTFAKLSWKTNPLADEFKAECSTNQTACIGLAHKLAPSGRYLLLGEKAFPRNELNQSGFHQPIPLVRLNEREVFVNDFNLTVDLERLNPDHFTKTFWDASKNQSLQEENCSMLMDSYMKQIENNKYFLEKPLQVMYTSALLFLFQDAGITQVSNTKLIGKRGLMAIGLSKDRFFNLKLKGDETVREIRVKIPLSSAITTFVGCGVIFVLMFLVLAFPTRRLRFLPGANLAEEYIEMHTDAYSDLIHEKNFKCETGEAVPTSDYEPERVTLLRRDDRDQAIHLH